MFNQVRRFGLTAAMLTLLLTVLAACGGSAGASPESRVDSFIKDINSAFNDKDIANEAKQEEWADKLSKYFLPAEQATQKAEVKEALAGMGSIPGMSIKIENAKVEKVSETGDNAEVKLVSGTMVMEAAGQKQEQNLAETGLVGGGSDNVKLQKVDGTWYILSNN
ncbi:MAG TPA: hypothetical protein VD886_06980 [Herpetosiphonaceae bacterium]|nr:hypothetical protein [Herpetosiphonaceae bacterium]